jgi:hypothetical protein
MNTRRTIDVTYRMARDRRKEAIGFFQTQEANVNMPLAARNVAGYMARGLQIIYRASFLTGGEKDWMFRMLIQKAKLFGVQARV